MGALFISESLGWDQQTKSGLLKCNVFQTYGYQRGKVGGVSIGSLGWHMHTMVYGMDVSGDLLYRTGNCTQCSVITYTAMDVCICKTESLCYTAEINTTL